MRDGFIRLTKCFEEVVLNPSKFQLGRSVYICKSKGCINLALKEKKILKMLRVSPRNLETIIPELEELSKLNTPAIGEARQRWPYAILDTQKVVIAK